MKNFKNLIFTKNAVVCGTQKVKGDFTGIKKILSLCIFTLLAFCVNAQDNIHPAPAYKGLLFIKNGNVHTGTGAVLANTTIQVKDGKIEKLGVGLPIPANVVKVIDATGKEVYPGLILSNSPLGLKEIGGGVPGSNDYRELGDVNPNVRSIVAYNTDSKITNTLRSNGILLAQVVPEGSVITGTSSIVQLDAWNWEDAVYKMDDGIHINMPSLFIRANRFGNNNNSGPAKDPLKESYDRIEFIKDFFRQAKAYLNEKAHENTNLKFEATKGLFNKEQTLFVHCDLAKEMLVAVDFAKEFKFNVCIIGGSESYQIAPLLKQNNLSVILGQIHRLPVTDDDDVDQPFKTPAVLQAAGVLFALTDLNTETTGRNLCFNAGTAAAYGLTKEQALAAITLNVAKILGIADKTGSIEVGKDANIIVSKGDLLDMRSSIVTDAVIQGRIINLDDKHKQLYRKYEEKYATGK